MVVAVVQTNAPDGVALGCSVELDAKEELPAVQHRRDLSLVLLIDGGRRPQLENDSFALAGPDEHRDIDDRPNCPTSNIVHVYGHQSVRYVLVSKRRGGEIWKRGLFEKIV